MLPIIRKGGNGFVQSALDEAAAGCCETAESPKAKNSSSV
jgi:hypothetical protein